MNDKPIELSCDLCDSCESIFAAPAYNSAGVLEEWVCSGLIQKPTDEKDIHDAMNTIRICLEKPGGLTSYEFTTWEASCVVTALSLSVTKDLENNQPTLARVEELIKLGYKDQNDEKQWVEGYFRKKKGGERKSVFVPGYYRNVQKEGEKTDK